MEAPDGKLAAAAVAVSVVEHSASSEPEDYAAALVAQATSAAEKGSGCHTASVSGAAAADRVPGGTDASMVVVAAAGEC